MSNPIKDFYWKIKFRFPRVNAVSVIGLLVAITALPAAVLLIRQATQLRSKAAPEAVTLSFSPSGVTLPPNQTISLNMDAKAYQIGFVRVDMSFDKSKVQLSGDIQTTSALKNVIVKTTQSDANNSGNISIALGLAPGDSANPPTGIFELAQIPFAVITANSNDSASLNITNYQIVNTALTQGIPADTQTLNFTLNPVATPTASAAPSLEPTQAPTTSPTVGPTTAPTVKPTPTQAPQGVASPSPTAASSSFVKGDIDEDGRVTILDYAVFFEFFGKTPVALQNSGKCDLNNDSKINILDYAVFFENFGKTN